MPSSAPFSYAQAAKGQTATVHSAPQTPTVTATPATSDTPAVPAPATAPTTMATQTKEDVATSSQISAEVSAVAESVDGKSRPSIESTTETPQTTASTSICSSSYDAQDDNAAAAVDTTRPIDDTSPNISAHSSDRGTGTSNDGSRQKYDADRKIKQDRKGKGKEPDMIALQTSQLEDSAKEPELPKPELSEAPIPAINVWQKRKEAQLAKVRAADGPPTRSKPLETATAAPSSSQAQDLPRRGKTAETSTPGAITGDVTHMNGNTGPRRRGDGPQEHLESMTRKGGPRAPKFTENRGKEEQVPFRNQVKVTDPASWPTPQGANEDAAKVTDKSLEGSDKDTHDDGAPSKTKSSGKKWIHLDFVPTVTFQTEIPHPKSGRGRGGGSARGGREGSSRLNHNGNAGRDADKSASATSFNKSGGETRDRTRDGGVPARSNSLPPASKRTSMDGSQARDQRKPSAPASATVERPREFPGSDAPQPTRERGEGRRGGGHRSRGGYHPVPPNINTQQAMYPSNGYPTPIAPYPHSLYSPSLQQNGMRSLPPMQTARGGRGAGASRNNGTMRQPHAGQSRPPHFATEAVPYDYPMPPSYPGMAYPRVPAPRMPIDPVLIPCMRAQIEYYFSHNNLSTDHFLRMHMFSGGWVPVHILATFGRVKVFAQHSDEPIAELILIACSRSAQVEVGRAVTAGGKLIDCIRNRDQSLVFHLPEDFRHQDYRDEGINWDVPHPRQPELQAVSDQLELMLIAQASPTVMTHSPLDPFSALVGPQPHSQQFIGGSYGRGLPGYTNGISGPREVQLSAETPSFLPNGPFSPTGFSPNANAMALFPGTNDADAENLNVLISKRGSENPATGSNGTYRVPSEATSAGLAIQNQAMPAFGDGYGQVQNPGPAYNGSANGVDNEAIRSQPYASYSQGL